jgi:hypothetical protein
MSTALQCFFSPWIVWLTVGVICLHLALVPARIHPPFRQCAVTTPVRTQSPFLFIDLPIEETPSLLQEFDFQSRYQSRQVVPRFRSLHSFVSVQLSNLRFQAVALLDPFPLFFLPRRIPSSSLADEPFS